MLEEYQRKGWGDWTAEDDEIWDRANKPPKKGQLAKARAAKRKTDNDAFLSEKQNSPVDP